MNCPKLCLVLLLVIAATTVEARSADEPSSGLPQDWLFTFLDRNNDDTIDADEVAEMPAPMRSWLVKSGIDPQGTITQADLDRVSKEMMEALRSGRYTSSASDVYGGFKREPARVKPDDDSTDGTSGTNVTASTRLPVVAPRNAVLSAPSLQQPTKKKATKTQLPYRYRSYDKDGDGQIGLYEWQPARLAEFERLDQNNDGFLILRELLSRSERAAKQKSVRNTAQARSFFSGRARKLFPSIDANHDGKVSAAEWSRSGMPVPDAKQVGKPVRFPISANEFADLYLKLNPGK